MFEWIIVGLVSGWLAGKIINGVGYGMFCDIMLGLVWRRGRRNNF